MANLARYVRFFGADVVRSDLRTVAESFELIPNGNRFPIPENLTTESERETNRPIPIATLIRRINRAKRKNVESAETFEKEFRRLVNLEFYEASPDDIIQKHIDEDMQRACHIKFINMILEGTERGDYDH